MWTRTILPLSCAALLATGVAASDVPARSGTLKVPGATLYHEMHGTGPMLLIIPGGPQDAGVFAGLARHLADDFTVVAFDPRGNSRSPFDGPPEPLDIDVQADDAARLIAALGIGPAFVFGASGGAQIGLNLVARHPDLVRALVAHEPPAALLLDDPTEALSADWEIHKAYLREGVDAAMARFFAMAALDVGANGATAPAAFDMTPEDAETFARVSGNFEYWLAHGMLPLSLYRPDADVLRSGTPPVIVALGEDSRGMPIHAMGSALARDLGVAPVDFPGDHLGFETDPAAFAETLVRELQSR